MPKILNRGRKIGDKHVPRKIQYPQGWDANGHPLMQGTKNLIDEIEPGKYKTVTDEQFKHLKAIFHDEIINLDDPEDLQSRFNEKPDEAPRKSYLSPEEVDAEVEKRVKEKMAAMIAEGDKEPEKPKKKKEVTAGPEKPSVRLELVQKIDGMDRGDIIAQIEQENLPIEHKGVKMEDLRLLLLEELVKRANAA